MVKEEEDDEDEEDEEEGAHSGDLVRVKRSSLHHIASPPGSLAWRGSLDSA